MTTAVSPLEGVRWTHHDVAVYARLDTVALEMFRDEVAFAAIDALDLRVEQLQKSEELVDRAFGADMYADLRQSSIEGFLLTTQSMQERGLRNLMLLMAKRQNWSASDCSKIKKAVWSGGKAPTLQDYFERLFDAPIRWFGNYEDLDFLQLLGNAIRHGDGASAEKLHQICPSLWNHWLPPGSALPTGNAVALDASLHPSFKQVTLGRAVLEQMLRSVFAFWEDVEFVRCNSFERTHPSTDKHMDELRKTRLKREANRVWTPA